MNKMIIPRKDHEVYFITLPDNIKAKLVSAYITEQMDRLHPGFSSASALDIQHFIFLKKRWIMATVMKAETLSEYKIYHKGVAFFTNTSIIVHKKEFTKDGIKIIDDERIGFDEEEGKPVSTPLESRERNANPILASEIKTIPIRHGVFNKKTHRGRIAAIITCVALMVLMTSAFSISRHNGSSLHTEEVSHAPFLLLTEPAIELKYLPSSIEILARLSADVIDAGGTIVRWQYNDNVEPLITVQLRGINVLTAQEICNQFEYVSLEDIRDVRYADEIPYITIFVNTSRDEYAIINAGAFPSQSLSLPIVNELTDAFLTQNISLFSEVLPSEANGNMFYAITYTAQDRDLINSLEIISAICQKYQLWIKNMDVSISNDNNIFTVVCSVSPSEIPYNITGQVYGKEKIPEAFGYKELRPLPVSLVVESSVIEPELEPELFIIGSIRDENGQRVFFRDAVNEKIQIRMSYE